MEFRPQRKVSSACSYCKQRKRKCSEKLPCENCVASHRHCEYGESTDGRRKESIQRARLDSAFHKGLLQGLLDKLRHGKDLNLNTLIQSNATLDDLAAYLSNTPSQSIIKVEATAAQPKTLFNCDEPGYDLGSPLGSPQKSLQTQSPPTCRKLYPACGFVDIPGDPYGILPATVPATGFDVQPREYDAGRDDQAPQPYIEQPLNTPTGHRLITTLLTRFRNSCQHALSLGIPEVIVLGSRRVNLETALAGYHCSSTLTPSVWTCDLQQKFESLDIYVRLAFIHLISQYMRWVIAPTVENFNHLPVCMRVTSTQRFVPHYAAIDLCHLPVLRDILINQERAGHGTSYEREDIVGFQVAGLRTNWDDSWNEAVVFDEDLGYHTLTDRFVDTVSRVDEWIAGWALLEKFPELQGTMRFADDRIIPVDRRQLFEIPKLLNR